MSNLVLAMRARGSEGEPLPTVFPGLAEVGAHFRRGQVSMIAGAPGTGKSAVATHIAVNADHTGYGDYVSSLYFSADSDRMTLGSRVAAGLERSSIGKIEDRVRADDPELWESIHERTSQMWLNWQTAPTLRDISLELEAYNCVYGKHPELVVIDNLMNVMNGDQDMNSQDGVVDYCGQMARETGAHVMLLCHLNGHYTNGNVMPPRDAVMNKLDKRPRLMVNLWTPEPGYMAMSVVKNSVGRADATGNLYVMQPWLPERSFFGPGEVIDR